MLYLVLAILSLGILVIIHEAGHFLLARLSGMRVDLFSIGFGPSIWRFTRGETTYQIAAVPLGGFVQIAGMNPGEEGLDADDPRAYPNRPAWQRLLTIFAGPGINYVFAALLLIGLNLLVGVQIMGKGAVVDAIHKNRPGAQAGLLPGDEILSVGGKPLTSYTDVATLVDASKGQPFPIEVLREGQHKTLTVTPAQDGGKWRIGIQVGPTAERRHLGAWTAVRAGTVGPFVLTWMNLQHLIDGIRGRQKVEFGGPVEIVQAMKQKISMGWVSGLEIVAFISTMLGFFNLLPFPALDGGRLVFLGWEVLTRRPVNPRVEYWVHAAGMAVLVPLIVFLLGRGFHKIISGGS